MKQQYDVTATESESRRKTNKGGSMDNEKHMEKIRESARKLLRAALLLSVAETPKDADDAHDACTDIILMVEEYLCHFDLGDLGYVDDCKKGRPAEEVIAEGDQILGHFRVPEKHRQELKKAFPRAFCGNCGLFPSVSGVCPDYPGTQD